VIELAHGKELYSEIQGLRKTGNYKQLALNWNIWKFPMQRYLIFTLAQEKKENINPHWKISSSHQIPMNSYSPAGWCTPVITALGIVSLRPA
jgi:hypothetical protein